MPLTLSVKDTITKIKINLDKSIEPFLGYIAKFHKFVPITEDIVRAMSGTRPENKDELRFLMCVDNNGNIYYWEEDCKKLSEKTLAGVVVHELMHTVLNHTSINTSKYNPTIANIAMDLVVNWYCSMLDVSLPTEVHEAGLYPHFDTAEFKIGETDIKIENISSKTWLMIYEEIMDQLKNNLECVNIALKIYKIDGHLFGESGVPIVNHDNQEIKDERYWKFKIAEAFEHCKAKGTKAGKIVKYLTKLLTPQISWKELLATSIVTSLDEEPTWRRSKRNSICRRLYLPSTYSTNLDIVVAIDTSGSVSDKTLEEFLSEVHAILQSFNNVRIDLLVCDTEVKAHVLHNYDSDNILNIPMEGRGGTSHKPVVDWINENRPDAKMLIAFTDGFSDIDSCFDNLPINCKRLIVLDSANRQLNLLTKYAEVIVINEN